MSRTRCLLLMLTLLVAASCVNEQKKENHRAADSLPTPAITTQHNNVTAVEEEDTSFFSEVRTQYLKVSFEYLEDTLLKRKLEKYFTIGDEASFPAYCHEYMGQNIGDTTVIFAKEKGRIKDYKVHISIVPFDSTKHRLTFDKQHVLTFIDNRIFWGTDGTIPGEELHTMTVQYKNQPIAVPASEYNDIFNVLLNDKSNLLVAIDKVTEHVYVILYGSDAAGSFTAAWIFKDGKYIRRVVETVC